MQFLSFSQLIQLYFVLISSIAILAGTLPALRNSILTYGKLDTPANSLSNPSPSPASSDGATKGVLKDNRRFVEILNSLRVPKTWFAHFYVLAPLWMIYLSVDLHLFTSTAKSGHWSTSYYPYFSLLHLLSFLGFMTPPQAAVAAGWIPPPEIMLAMACYFAQVTRRWYESQFIERPSPKATLHIGHYIIGMTYYSAMAPTIWVDAYEAWAAGSSNNTAALSTAGILQCLVGLSLFLWGSLHQFNCHVILANLRSSSVASIGSGSSSAKTSTEYRVPFGDWFQYMVTPHYSAEMVLYFGMYLIVSARRSAPTMLISWIWIVINLGIVARETDQWYRARFGEQYYKQAVDTKIGRASRPSKQTGRRAILVPFIY